MSGINYELNNVDFLPLLFCFPFFFSSLGLQAKNSSLVGDFSFEKSQKTTDTVISPADPARGGRAGGVEDQAQAGRGRITRGPERLLCLCTSSKIRIRAVTLAPSLLPFCNISVLSAVSLVCLWLEKAIHSVIETFLLFKQRKLYQVPALLRNEVILTFLK